MSGDRGESGLPGSAGPPGTVGRTGDRGTNTPVSLSSHTRTFSLIERCQQYRLALYCHLIVIIQVNLAYRGNLEVRAN